MLIQDDVGGLEVEDLYTPGNFVVKYPYYFPIPHNDQSLFLLS